MVVSYHEQFGHLYVPALRARLPHVGGYYHVRTNTLGFRSDREFVKPKGKKPRILVLGDSFAAGDGCDIESCFPTLIGDYLDAEVYCYALSGSGPDQQLLMHEQLALDVEADLIVWAIAVHTIERIVAAFRPTFDPANGRHVLVPKPYFKLVDGELELNHVPVPRERPEVSEAAAGEYEQGQLQAPLLERIYLSPPLRPVRMFIRDHLWSLKAGLRGSVYRMTGVQPYQDYENPQSSGWQFMTRIMRRFKDKRGAIPVLVVPLPTYTYYSDNLRPVYHDLFDAAIDEQAGFHVYNVTAGLAPLSLRERDQCGLDDGHYSEFGHAQIGRLLADEIARRGLLRKPSRALAPVSERSSGYVLGIACFFHGSAAALVHDGQVVSAADESVFTRRPGEIGFPQLAANYCLEEAGIQQEDLDAVVFYCNPAFVLREALAGLAGDAAQWTSEAHLWLERRADVCQQIRRYLQFDGVVAIAQYERAICAAAYYPCGFERAAIVAVDVAAKSVIFGKGEAGRIEVLERRSLGRKQTMAGLLAEARALAGVEALAIVGAEDIMAAEADALERSSPHKIWCQPAMAAVAGAMGAALDAFHHRPQAQRVSLVQVGAEHARLGPGYGHLELGAYILTNDYAARTLDNEALAQELAEALLAGARVGLFDGRMEVSARGLSGRVVLHRPSEVSGSGELLAIQAEYAAELIAAPAAASPFGLLRAPAVSAQDNNPPARFITVERKSAPRLWDVLEAYRQVGGGSVLALDSLRLAGEPLACTPGDAYRCLMLGDMQMLALGNRLLEKDAQTTACAPLPVSTRAEGPHPLAAALAGIHRKYLAGKHLADARAGSEGGMSVPAIIIFEACTSTLAPRALARHLTQGWPDEPATATIQAVIEALGKLRSRLRGLADGD
ncbi:MAG: hypothetical protein GKR94_25320 [Gammaproteobacteria bacterium]|nr:hypothetical protein [Gammaproteobacteria bacterium]